MADPRWRPAGEVDVEDTATGRRVRATVSSITGDDVRLGDRWARHLVFDARTGLTHDRTQRIHPLGQSDDELAPWPCAKSACSEPALPHSEYCAEHDVDAAAEWDRYTDRLARKAARP